MKCHHIEARDLPDAWFQLVDLCYSEGRDYLIGEGSYAGSQYRRELDFATIKINFPMIRPLLPEIPLHYGIPNPVPGGIEYIEEQYLSYLMTDQIKKNEKYTYGQRLFGKFNRSSSLVSNATNIEHNLTCQVEEIIAKFKRGFANNQCCMTIAIPEDVVSPDPPCMRLIDCRVFPDDKKLHLFVYFRSWDLWGGFPANMAAIVYLQEYMANEIGINPGEIIAASKGLHLYDMYWDLAKIRFGDAGR